MKSTNMSPMKTWLLTAGWLTKGGQMQLQGFYCTVDDPVFVEFNVNSMGGGASFIVVLDEEDDIEMFAKALQQMTGKSLDYNIIQPKY